MLDFEVLGEPMIMKIHRHIIVLLIGQFHNAVLYSMFT